MLFLLPRSRRIIDALVYMKILNPNIKGGNREHWCRTQFSKINGASILKYHTIVAVLKKGKNTMKITKETCVKKMQKHTN